MNQSLLQLFRKWMGKGGDTEAAEEIAGYASKSAGQAVGTAETYNLGPQSAVRLSPIPAEVRSELGIAYSGPLASQAEKVYVRCGEGPGDWRNVRDVPMEKDADSGEWFVQVQTAEEPGTLEFCFHDGSDHWDNNNGRNWNVTVH